MTDGTPLPEVHVKMCTRCSQTKSRSEFHKCTARKDGLNPWCKECHRKHRREKPSGTCEVEGCVRATSGGQRKCDPCYAGEPPLTEARGTRPSPWPSTRGMPRHDDHGNRLCSHCLTYLPVSQFGSRSSVSDGLVRICRPCSRIRYVHRKYGLTIQEAEEMWAAPCGICGFFEAGTMVIDHCHGSGVVRGTLCHPCNVSIGHFGDDPALLDKASQYLRRFLHGQASQDPPERTEVRHAPRAKGWSTHKRRKSISP